MCPSLFTLRNPQKLKLEVWTWCNQTHWRGQTWCCSSCLTDRTTSSHLRSHTLMPRRSCACVMCMFLIAAESLAGTERALVNWSGVASDQDIMGTAAEENLPEGFQLMELEPLLSDRWRTSSLVPISLIRWQQQCHFQSSIKLQKLLSDDWKRDSAIWLEQNQTQPHTHLHMHTHTSFALCGWRQGGKSWASW